MNKRSRGWCFTINNYTDDDIAYFMCLEDHLSFRYAVAGFEKGSKKNTPHMQCYVYYEHPQTFSLIQESVPRAAHIQEQKARRNELAYEYCKKDGDYYEIGVPPSQGMRSDLDRLIADQSNGMSLAELKTKYPKQALLYGNKLERMYNIRKNPKRDKELYLIPLDKKYEFASKHDDVFMDFDLETYGSEDVMIVNTYHFDVIAWIKGYPHRIRRGYEIISLDPDILYITYAGAEEYNYNIKHYGDYFTAVENI